MIQLYHYLSLRNIHNMIKPFSITKLPHEFAREVVPWQVAVFEEFKRVDGVGQQNAINLHLHALFSRVKRYAGILHRKSPAALFARMLRA